MTRISIVSSWLCSTGVAVISSYCILTHHANTPAEQKKAAEVATRIAKRGLIPEYKPTNRHSSAVRKTTVARVTAKDVKVPTYVANPLYPFYTNALNDVMKEVAEIAKDGEVILDNGFALAVENGKPSFKFPESYCKVVIGNVAMGDELKGWDSSVSRKWIGGSDQWKVDAVDVHMYKRLAEPEFYCTSVTYSAIPATKQVDSIRMRGNLEVGNTSKAYAMVDEIAKWMKEDFGAVDQRVVVPAGTVAYRKFKIGKGMDVEVAVKWNQQKSSEKGDASIEISFTTGELAEENQYERQELGAAVDAARVSVRYNSNVNYYTVRPKVTVDQIKNKVVY